MSFDAVSFAYVPGRDILSNLSFTVKPGQKVAIVGSSGSGYDLSTVSFHLIYFCVVITTAHLLPYYACHFWQEYYLFLPFICSVVSLFCLQCFDTVGWVAGRASGL